MNPDQRRGGGQVLAPGDYAGWTSTLSGQWGRRLRLGSEPCRQLGACLEGDSSCQPTVPARKATTAATLHHPLREVSGNLGHYADEDVVVEPVPGSASRGATRIACHCLSAPACHRHLAYYRCSSTTTKMQPPAPAQSDRLQRQGHLQLAAIVLAVLGHSSNCT